MFVELLPAPQDEDDDGGDDEPPDELGVADLYFNFAFFGGFDPSGLGGTNTPPVRQEGASAALLASHPPRPSAVPAGWATRKSSHGARAHGLDSATSASRRASW